MILHDRPIRLTLTRHARPGAPCEPQPVRKANRLGERRRRQFLRFIRRRGTVTLAQLCERWGRQVVLTTLDTLWEAGLIDVLDRDRFRLKESTP